MKYNTVKLLSGHHCAASHPCLSLELTRENCTNFAKNCWLLCENATQTGKFRFALEMFKNFVKILLRSLNSSWSSSLEYTLSKHWQRRGEGVGEEGGGRIVNIYLLAAEANTLPQGPLYMHTTHVMNTSLPAYYPCYEYLSTCILPMLWFSRNVWLTNRNRNTVDKSAQSWELFVYPHSYVVLYKYIVWRPLVCRF